MFNSVKSVGELNEIFEQDGGHPTRIFLYGDNMTGKTYRALQSDNPENIYLVSLDCKSLENSDKAQTIDINSVDEFERTIKFLRKQPKDKVVILDIISRLDDVIAKYINQYFGVNDFQQPEQGYNSQQGWGMHTNMWKNVASMIRSLPQSRIIITDHTISMPLEKDAKGNVVDWESKPSIYGVRPNKPQVTTRIMDGIDVVIKTTVRNGKVYKLNFETNRGEESVSRAKLILKEGE
jgi:hypothetical protein